MSLKTPKIYARGKWTISSPFTVPSTSIYTCMAIRSIDDLIARNIDPYAMFYAPNGIDTTKYEQDVDNLVNIITLMSDIEPMVYVPDTYILSYPDITVVPYRHLVLSLSMGAVPDTLVLDDLINKVKEYSLSSIGIDPTVKINQNNVISEGLDLTAHQVYENNRLANIVNNKSNYQLLTEANARIDELNTYILALEQIVKDNGLLE